MTLLKGMIIIQLLTRLLEILFFDYFYECFESSEEVPTFPAFKSQSTENS